MKVIFKQPPLIIVLPLIIIMNVLLVIGVKLISQNNIPANYPYIILSAIPFFYLLIVSFLNTIRWFIEIKKIRGNKEVKEAKHNIIYRETRSLYISTLINYFIVLFQVYLFIKVTYLNPDNGLLIYTLIPIIYYEFLLAYRSSILTSVINNKYDYKKRVNKAILVSISSFILILTIIACMFGAAYTKKSNLPNEVIYVQGIYFLYSLISTIKAYDKKYNPVTSSILLISLLATIMSVYSSISSILIISNINKGTPNYVLITFLSGLIGVIIGIIESFKLFFHSVKERIKIRNN